MKSTNQINLFKLKKVKEYNARELVTAIALRKSIKKLKIKNAISFILVLKEQKIL